MADQHDEHEDEVPTTEEDGDDETAFQRAMEENQRRSAAMFEAQRHQGGGPW